MGAALRVAADKPEALGPKHILALLTADGVDLEAVCRLADDVRQSAVGNDVTDVVNGNVNFMSVSCHACRFCGFPQRRTDADAHSLSLEEVEQRAVEAWAIGAT